MGALLAVVALMGCWSEQDSEGQRMTTGLPTGMHRSSSGPVPGGR